MALAMSLQLSAQEVSTRDSIANFYDSLLYHLQQGYLYKDSVDWESTQPIKQEALQAASFGEALAFCTPLFDTIGGSHLNIFSDHGWFHWSKGREYRQLDFHKDFLVKLESEPGFTVDVIDNTYGYILMPGMLMIDLTQDSINRASQQMYDQVMEVAESNDLKGWIIDLRFNVGGNVFPMLAALYHFLGDNTAFVSLDQEGAIDQLAKLDSGVVYDGRKEMAAITLSQTPDTQVPVALITGIITASSGELVAVSFRNRAHVHVIGEPSAGMLTGNDLTELPYDVKLTLTTGYLADRKGLYTPLITPEQVFTKQANFTDMLQDVNIKAAMDYLNRVSAQ